VITIYDLIALYLYHFTGKPVNAKPAGAIYIAISVEKRAKPHLTVPNAHNRTTKTSSSPTVNRLQFFLTNSKAAMLPGNTATKIPMGDTVDSSGPQSVFREKRTCNYAIASLICGIVGFVAFGIILGPIAIVLGRNAIERIDANPYEFEGKQLAQVGVICGIIVTTWWIISFPIFTFIIISTSYRG
jgi:hypothetical protein